MSLQNASVLISSDSLAAIEDCIVWFVTFSITIQRVVWVIVSTVVVTEHSGCDGIEDTHGIDINASVS